MSASDSRTAAVNRRLKCVLCRIIESLTKCASSSSRRENFDVAGRGGSCHRRIDKHGEFGQARAAYQVGQHVNDFLGAPHRESRNHQIAATRERFGDLGDKFLLGVLQGLVQAIPKGRLHQQDVGAANRLRVAHQRQKHARRMRSLVMDAA